MKILIPTLAAAGLAVGLIAGLAGAKDDASVINDVISTMTSEQLSPAASTGGGSAVPELTKPQVEAIVNDLKEIEKHNGILGIARRNKAATWQVKAVVARIKLRLQELAPPIDLNP